ncbi:MAG: hypothetical protein KF791_08495 [Verrucomicrobiae bacterium]|nr:hypothetical protein [Verrucomicrobiae bacterium]
MKSLISKIAGFGLFLVVLIGAAIGFFWGGSAAVAALTRAAAEMRGMPPGYTLQCSSYGLFRAVRPSGIPVWVVGSTRRLEAINDAWEDYQWHEKRALSATQTWHDCE